VGISGEKTQINKLIQTSEVVGIVCHIPISLVDRPFELKKSIFVKHLAHASTKLKA